MKKPVMDELPFDLILSEAGVRENYLSKYYLPDVVSQASDGLFSKMIETMHLKKGFGYGRGRSGAAARDFVNRMKTHAKYTGRNFDGEVRPMCYFLEDLTVTYFPPPKSFGLLISGSGEKESVFQKARACLKLGIDTIVFSYEPRSVVAKLGTVYHHIPKKIKDPRGTVDVMGNSFETAANISCYGLVEGLVEYHKSKDINKASDVSMQHISDSISYVRHVGDMLPSIKQELMDLGKMLGVTDHVRLCGSADIAASLYMAMNRLAHVGRLGMGTSIDPITSDNYGKPGNVDIEKNDLVIISSAEMESSHTIAIGREATNVGAKLCLIASDKMGPEDLERKMEKYKIKMPEICIKLPYSLPGSDIRFFDLGVRHVLEYQTAAVFDFLGISKEELEGYHLQGDLE